MDKTTRKKMKVIGTEDYINTSTGEIESMNVVRIEERDANFHKIWIAELMRSLDLISNRKTKIAYHLLEVADKENKIIKSYDELAKECGVSYQTVAVTMKALVDAKFLTRKRNGVYFINPNVVFKGTRNNRLNVLYQFCNITTAQQRAEKLKEMSEPSEVSKAASEPSEVSKAASEPSEVSKAASEPSEVSKAASEPSEVSKAASEPSEV